MIPIRNLITRFHRIVSRYQSTVSAGPGVNSKLSDITKQIKQTIDLGNIDESKDIFKEGLQYIRQIETHESIPSNQIKTHFLPLTNSIVSDLNSTVELENFVNFLIEYNLIHPFYIIKLASLYLKQHQYDKVLQVFLLMKENEYRMIRKDKVNLKVDANSSVNFNIFHIYNMVYYAYVQICIHQNKAYSIEDAKRLINRTDLPSNHNVSKTLMLFKIFDKNEFSKFVKYLNDLRIENYDPNRFDLINSIKVINDKESLDKLYFELINVSNKKQLSVDEKVIVEIMEKYFYFKQYDEVFNLIQHLLSSNIQPSINSWNVVIKAMTNPTNIKRKNQQQIQFQFEKLLNTIEAMGLNHNDETLIAIISAYSNFNQFDKVKQILENNNKVPMGVYDAILRGLIFNNNINEAETKLQQFVNQNNYVPTTQTMNEFLTYYSKLKNFNAIKGIISFMNQHKIQQDIATITILLDNQFKSLFEIGKVPDLNSILSIIQINNSSIKFNEHSLTSILNGLIKAGKIKSARALYNIIKVKFPNSTYIHNSQMIGEINHGDLNKSVEIFNNLIKIKNDTISWNTFIRNLLPKNDHLAKQYFYKLLQSPNVKPNKYSFYFMLQYYINKQNYQEIETLLEMLNKNKLPDYGQIPMLLKRLNASIIPEELLHLVNQ